MDLSPISNLLVIFLTVTLFLAVVAAVVLLLYGLFLKKRE